MTKTHFFSKSIALGDVTTKLQLADDSGSKISKGQSDLQVLFIAD